MSLRKIAKILGIAPTYRSLLLNGKRAWRGKLKERYEELVNTFVNTPRWGEGEKGAGTDIVVGGNGFEPMTSAMSTQRSKPLS